MKHVVVIGGGVIGLCTAYSLHARGCEVTLLDAGRFGSGASYGNAGWITPSLSGPVPAPGIAKQSIRWMFDSRSPLYIKPRFDPGFALWLMRFWSKCRRDTFRQGLAATAALNERTFELFDELVRDGVTFEQHTKGLLFAFESRSGLETELEILELMRPFGYAPQVMDARQTQSLEPALSGNVVGGLWVKQERQVRPDDLVVGLVKRLLDDGLDLREDAPVTAIEMAGRTVTSVRVGDEPITADAFVVATGAWMPRLTRTLGIRVPVEAGKGYSIDFTPPPLQIGHALYLYEARVAVTPFADRVRLAGTMELSGLNDRIVGNRVDAITDAASRYLEGWSSDARGNSPWTGMRPMTPDGLPIIGRAPECPNLFLAGGHAMLGVTLGPATGEALADLIVSGSSPQVLQPFDPSRFSPRRSRIGALKAVA